MTAGQKQESKHHRQTISYITLIAKDKEEKLISIAHTSILLPSKILKLNIVEAA
jgi:hypothetical protein